MLKNVAGQFIGTQMINATTGAAFTGSVSMVLVGDNGAQGGGGACTHKGNGYHSYALAQADTNYGHIAFTFTGTGAVPVTVQVFPVVATDSATDWTADERDQIRERLGLDGVKVAPSEPDVIPGVSQEAFDLWDSNYGSAVDNMARLAGQGLIGLSGSNPNLLTVTFTGDLTFGAFDLFAVGRGSMVHLGIVQGDGQGGNEFVPDEGTTFYAGALDIHPGVNGGITGAGTLTIEVPAFNHPAHTISLAVPAFHSSSPHTLFNIDGTMCDWATNHNLGRAFEWASRRATAADVAAVPAAVDAALSASHGAELWTSNETAAAPFPYAVYQSGHDGDAAYAIPDVLVVVYNNAAGQGNPITSARTDETGVALLSLDSGRYYLFLRRAGYAFDNPKEIVVD